MPKMKTHSGTKKRMRLTGSGKILRKKANRRHILEKKTSDRKRRLAGYGLVAKADERNARKLLGG